VVKTKHGRLHVRIGEPISLHEAAKGRVDRAETAIEPGALVYTAAHKQLVAELGYEVVHEHQRMFVITIPTIFASLCLHYAENGTEELPTAAFLADAEALVGECTIRGHSVDAHLLDNVVMCKSLGETLAADLDRWMRPLAPAAALSADRAHVLVRSAAAEQPFRPIRHAHLRNEALHVFAAEALALLSAVSSPSNAVDFSQFKFLHSAVYVEVLLETKSDAELRIIYSKALHNLQRTGLVALHGSGGYQLNTENAATTGLLAPVIMRFVTPFVRCTANLALYVGSPAAAAATLPTAAELPKQVQRAWLPTMAAATGWVPAECLAGESVRNSAQALVRLGALEVGAGGGLVVVPTVLPTVLRRLRAAVDAADAFCSGGGASLPVRRKLPADGPLPSRL
jgi:hypothetical protein